MGAGGASRLASGIGLSLSSCSARVGVRGTCRRSVSKGKGLDSCCSSGILAVGTEEDDGPDRCSSKGSEAFAFPFPLLRGSVLGRTVTPFPLSRMDLGSVGGRHAFPCGIGLTVNGLSDGETVLLPAIEIPADVEAVFAPQSSSGCAPHPRAAFHALTDLRGGGDKGRGVGRSPRPGAAISALTSSRGGEDKGRGVDSVTEPDLSPYVS
jgi:hypothetical protein